MNIQIIAFPVEKSDNIITSIGRLYISHPKIHFTGRGIKWYEDKPKQQHNNKNG